MKDLLLSEASGVIIEDIENRLSLAGFLDLDNLGEGRIPAINQALESFSRSKGIKFNQVITEELWLELVESSFCLGDRSLYLKMPYFHGSDVRELQEVLSILGFGGGDKDGIFGYNTENALRKFQENMGLPSDGFAGSATFITVKNLQHSYHDKSSSTIRDKKSSGFARAAQVLENNPICIFGRTEFTSDIANRISNLAYATTFASKVVSAKFLKSQPEHNMMKIEIVLECVDKELMTPWVTYSDDSSFVSMLKNMFSSVNPHDPRLSICMPTQTWNGCSLERSSQHFAVEILDAICMALDDLTLE